MVKSVWVGSSISPLLQVPRQVFAQTPKALCVDLPQHASQLSHRTRRKEAEPEDGRDPQTGRAKIGVAGSNHLIKALHCLVKLRADTAKQKVAIRRHVTQHERGRSLAAPSACGRSA